MLLRGMLAVTAILTFAAPAAADANTIFGTWMRGDGAAKVQMAPCGSEICATNVWIKDAAKQGENVGDKLVFKIAAKGDEWDGTAYDPQRKLNLSAKLKANGDKMVSTGCVFAGMICRSTQWTRTVAAARN